MRKTKFLKACTLFRKRPTLDPEAFQKYWHTDHVNFVTKMPNVRRYVQNHPLLDGESNKKAPYDGFVELWVDDIGALKTLAASPEYAAVVEDEKRFAIDLTLTEENVILDGEVPAGAVKLIVALKRRPGMRPEEFQDYWKNKHAPLVGTPPGLCRYAQSYTKLAGYRGDHQPNWDGFGEMWFTSLEAANAARSAPGQDKVREDGANVANISESLSLFVTERIMRG